MKYVALAFLAILPGCSLSQLPSPPIIGAARRGDLNAIRTLAASGADLNQRAGVNGWTPLMHAIHKNQPGAVRELLLLRADPNLPGSVGMTALMMAAGYGFEGMVRDLLKAGADPRVKHPDGSTALDVAVSGVPDIDRFTVGRCQTGTVRALLEAAPDVRLQNSRMDRLARSLQGGTDCEALSQLIAGR